MTTTQTQARETVTEPNSPNVKDLQTAQTPATYSERVAAVVRAQFTKAGRTADELADILEMPGPSALRRWSGTRPYLLSELDGVAQALGVSVASLLQLAEEGAERHGTDAPSPAQEGRGGSMSDSEWLLHWMADLASMLGHPRRGPGVAAPGAPAIVLDDGATDAGDCPVPWCRQHLAKEDDDDPVTHEAIFDAGGNFVVVVSQSGDDDPMVLLPQAEDGLRYDELLAVTAATLRATAAIRGEAMA